MFLENIQNIFMLINKDLTNNNQKRNDDTFEVSLI